MKLCFVLLNLSVAATLLLQCDARNETHFEASRARRGLSQAEDSSFDILRKIRPSKRLGVDPAADSPFSLPPLDDSYGYEAPLAMPQNSPPFSINPPSFPTPTPTPQTTSPPTPDIISEPPPPTPLTTSPPTPDIVSEPPPPPSEISTPVPPGLPNSPEYVPSPPGTMPSPPEEFVPTPPSVGVSPPEGYVSGPPEGYVPGPPYFLPPVVFPPPAVPPPPHSGPGLTLWCVAKPTVPDPIIQEAMNYACGSGADCQSIQPDGSCYEPDTLLSHASLAFNSYWQRTKAAGGTCDFGGIAMLITQDPSFDECRFIYY